MPFYSGFFHPCNKIATLWRKNTHPNPLSMAASNEKITQAVEYPLKKPKVLQK